MHHQSFNDPRFVEYRLTGSNANRCNYYIQLHNWDLKWRPRTGDCVSGHYLSHYDNNRWRQAYTSTYESVSFLGFTPATYGSCQEGMS
ncbi:MAG: hypothetical protein ACK56I_04010, partial [bacterium]